jgi:hypothetical protein
MTGGCCDDHERDDSCGCPSGFVRVRYYFGQRIGVPEMTDATRYVVGKTRFANFRLHGVGVLCGLRAARVPEDPLAGAQTVVLQVCAGAALDGCGREVVVGSDQCINVAAWFAANRTRTPYRDWTAGTTQTLWVVLRYRECPTDPNLALRDPCGCDATGCEFGRVMEGFELALVPAHDTIPIAAPVPFGGVATAPAACPPTDPGSWLVLAQFDVTLADVAGTVGVTGIGKPDNTIPERIALLSTQALQAMLLALAGSGGANPFTPGPRFGALGIESDTRLTLALDGVTDPLAAGTFVPDHFRLRKFDGTQWVDPKPKVELAPGKVTLTLLTTAALKDADRYRLVYAPPPEAPLVDSALRPVTPNPLVRQFRAQKTGTTWTVADV